MIDLLNSNDYDKNSYVEEKDIVNLDINIDVMSVKRPNIKASLKLLRTLFALLPNLSYDMFIDKELIDILPKTKFNNPYDLFRSTAKVLYLEIRYKYSVYNIYPFVYVKLVY